MLFSLVILYFFIVIGVDDKKFYLHTYSRFKKDLWRKAMPKGLKLKKYFEGPDGVLIHDDSYIGEDAWEDDPDPSQESIAQVIQSDEKLNEIQKEEMKKDLGITGKQSLTVVKFLCIYLKQYQN